MATDLIEGYTSRADDTPSGPLSVDEFLEFFAEIEQQPPWRTQADKEMDYVDGNQLNSEILQKQRRVGMPPAIEPLIGPAIDSVLGMEAKNRADWRVTPNSDTTGDELAKAMGFELNQAERKSKADRACSDAYRAQICVGIGWVEVSRHSDPFKYAYRCQHVHRNQIWWDWLSTEPDLSDARYLVRKQWTDIAQVKLMIPKSRALLDKMAGGWMGFDPTMGMDGGRINDGGNSTGLAMSHDQDRNWTIEEHQWRDHARKRVCLFEVWYRRWVRVVVLKTPDGRVVECDLKNPMHALAVSSGQITPEFAVVPKMRKAVFMGPHRLSDGPTPYRHQKFPYIPFWGKREDRTNVPYGLVRGMIFLQDNVNATVSKLRWGLSSSRSIRTEGAVVGTDEQFRNNISMVNADIVLSAQAMSKPGARFEVMRDFQLNDQQFQMLVDSRDGIMRVAGINPAFKGSTGTAQSGIQEATQVEQGTQALADINDGFNYARAEVGELLLALIIEDSIGKERTIKVSGQAIKDDFEVPLNKPAVDPDTGIEYRDNDIERAMLKVEINDVPSTSTYRAQQLSAMSEAIKSMQPEIQRVMAPYLAALMDLPTDTREDIIKAVREAAATETPEQIEERIQKAVADARMKDARDLKLQELSMKYTPELLQEQIREIVAKTFKTNTEALYAAGQTAAALAMNPSLAPATDVVSMAAGYRAPNPAGVDPNLPIAEAATAVAPAMRSGGALGVGGGAASEQQMPGGLGQPNSSPMSPPTVPMPPTPMSGPAGTGEGIETIRTEDNLPA